MPDAAEPTPTAVMSGGAAPTNVIAANRPSLERLCEAMRRTTYGPPGSWEDDDVDTFYVADVQALRYEILGRWEDERV